MKLRFSLVIAMAFAGLGAVYQSSGQQITSDIVVSGASTNDGYGNSNCDEHGELYRIRMNARPGGEPVSVMRVAKDGSTVLIMIPQPDWGIQAISPSSDGLIVAANPGDGAERGLTHIYHFDLQGKLQSQRTVSLDFQLVAMAETKSGMTIAVGYRPRLEMNQEARTYGGAVLNASDKVVTSFEFQPTTNGGRWKVVSTHRMWVDDRGASVALQSGDDDPNYAIATIDESGQIRILPLLTVRDARYHDWFFAKGVAAELYQFAEGAPPRPVKIDAFDLVTGKNLGTKTRPNVGFADACYLGDEMSMTAHSAHVEKSRGLSPDALRLVTVKLE
jgi:hypothetical protein